MPPWLTAGPQGRRRHRIVYIPGNHEELLREYPGISVHGIEVHLQAVHEATDGRFVEHA